MKNLLYSLLFLFSHGLFSQSLSPADYHRAESFLWQNLNNQLVFNLHTNVIWSEDNQWIGFYKYVEGHKSFYFTNLRNFKTSKMFDHKDLANQLSTHAPEPLHPANINLSSLKIHSKNLIEFEFENLLFQYNIKKKTLKKVEKFDPIDPFTSTSPDEKHTAYSENHNLFITNNETGNKSQLTSDGREGYEHATYYGWADIIKGENGDRPPRFAVRWSPDSKYLVSPVLDFTNANKMYLLDWSQDSLYRPELLSYYRGSPGDTNMVVVQNVVFNIETGKKAPLNLPITTHINTPSLLWDPSRPVLYVLKRERGFKKIQLVAYNLESGAEKLLYEESSPTNIDNFRFQLVESLNSIVFLSEKSGWRQMYALDLETDKIRALTTGTFYIQDILEVDPKSKDIYATASGLDPSDNPYFQQLIKIPFDGGDIEILTDTSLDHRISLSPDLKYFVDNASTVNTPTNTTLRSVKGGKKLSEISSADIHGINAKGYISPEIFTTTAKDGKTTIYGTVWKPTHFDPENKYPVIDQTYTGPHTHMFPDNFLSGFRRSNQALAELGFVVVAVDGLGTAGRSKEFHDHSYKNMGGNLEDHVIFIKELGKKHSWADTTRVGIFGHSAGGFDAAHALLEYPDFYKVGVASSADHDFRMEKAWWPEMYMGWPVDSSYHKVSNITMAGNLKGKLLITHGGIDENVNPSASFKLAEALVKANKQFDMMIFPGQRHGYRGHVGEYFRKLRWNYFVEHLLGIEPLWEW